MPSKPRHKQLFVYDFTASCATNTVDKVREICKKFAKKFVFQKEMGNNGFLHFQGKWSLHEKIAFNPKHMHEKFGCDWHFSESQTDHKEDYSYCHKVLTRIEGPWKWDDPIIPPDFNLDTVYLKPWHTTVLKLPTDPRKLMY